MRIVNLIDNTSLNNHQLKAEHGLALYIEIDQRKILFDTGQSSLFMENAKSLHIDLQAIDTVVISHAHYDHTGGLLDFLNTNKHAKVILKKDIFEASYFSIRGKLIRDISPPRQLISYSDRFHFLESDFHNDGRLFFIQNIQQTHQLPKANSILFSRKGNQDLQPDTFSHELIMGVNTSKGLVIFTGCAHNGILNMLESVKKHLPEQEIVLIYGGLHLPDGSEYINAESEKELHELSDQLKTLAKKATICTGHCTGKDAIRALKEQLDPQLTSFHSGHVINIPD